MDAVRVEVSRSVARVVLDRPPLNVIDLDTARELSAALEEVKRRRDLAAVVLAGQGRAFSAGVDVRDHLPDRGQEMIRGFDRCCRILLEVDSPVVAAVHGAALGGGAELALVCDLVVAADAATFGFPEIKLGVFPPVAAVELARMVSPQRAAELVLTGRTLSAAEAERFGIVNRVVAASELETAVEKLLDELRSLSPEALRVAKRALRLARPRAGAALIDESERLYLDQRLEAPDAVEGLRAFLEKRAPVWTKT